MKFTKEQVNEKYKDRYIEIISNYDFEKKQCLYEVGKTYKKIHENTTLGQDVGTNSEYMR
jgi:hypothetical protein